jgi:hypothetical protein
MANGAQGEEALCYYDAGGIVLHRHSRESGNLQNICEIPAFAGMTV